jgi:hypothetical protein
VTLLLLAAPLNAAPASAKPGSARPAGAEPANLLLNGGAEQGKNDQPSMWGAASVAAPELKMSRDTTTARAGKASLFISNGHKYDQPTANNWAQTLQSVPRGRTVVVSGWIKTADADAVNICLQCWDAGGKEMVGFASTPVVRGDQDWVQLESDPLVVPAKTQSIMVRAALSGLGKAWFDDVTVTEVEGAAAGADGKPAKPGVGAGGPPAVTGEAAKAAPVTPASLDKGLRSAVKGEVVEVHPVDRDQMVLSYIPDWAHGRVDNLAVEVNEMGGVRTLFAWPKPAIKGDGHRFLLACYARERTVPEENKPGKIGAYEVLGEWDEQTPWTSQPKTADKPLAEFNLAAGEGWVTFDVTPLVRKQLAGGAPSHGVMLRFVDEDSKGARAGYAFVSREGEAQWEARRPLLLVVKE